MWQLLSYFNFAILMLRKGQNAFLFTLPVFIYYPVGLADYRDKWECLPFEIFTDKKLQFTETFFLHVLQRKKISTLSTRIWHMTFWSMTFSGTLSKVFAKVFCYKKFWGLFGTGDEGNCMVLKLEGVPHDKLESYDYFCKALVTLDQNMYS